MTETNRAKVERFYQFALAGDTAGINSLLHPQFIGYEADGLPYAGTYHGVEGWWHLVQTVYSTWKDFTPEIQYIMTDDSGQRVGAMLKISGADITSGEKFQSTLFELWGFQDGLISEVRPYYWDTQMLSEIYKRGKQTKSA